MKNRWWWLDSKNEHEKCEPALRWETLRRTKAYAVLWRKWQKKGSVFQSLRENSGWPAIFRKAHFDACAKDAIGVECYSLLCNGFNPRLHWLELSQAQRLAARGFVPHRDEGNETKEAIKVGPELSLPRETSHDHTSVLLGVCEIDRDSNRRLSVKEIKGVGRVADVRNTELFQSLNLTVPGMFLYASFDTRVSRDVLLDVLDEWIARPSWLILPMAACQHQVPGCEVHVIPTDQPAYAICLVPAKYGSQGFRDAFHTQLKRDRFHQWHRRCVNYWKTLTFANQEPKLKADGLPVVEGGCLVYETVTRCQFDPARHLPPKKNPGKSARRADLWLGLAANDVVRDRQSLGKKAPLGAFLIGYCKSCQELRNHQKSAEKRLREIDKSLGRLDKKLSYWIRENAKLDHKGFFTAAADGAAF